MNAKELQSLFDKYNLGAIELIKQEGSDFVDIIAKDHPDDIRINNFGDIPEMDEIVWEDYEIENIFFRSDAWAHPQQNGDKHTGRVGSEFGIYLSNDEHDLSGDDVTVSRVEAVIRAVQEPLSYQIELLHTFLDEMNMVKMVFEPLLVKNGFSMQSNDIFRRGGCLGYQSELNIVYAHPSALPGSSIIFTQDICTGRLFYTETVETSSDDWRGAMCLDGRRLRPRKRYLNCMLAGDMLQVIWDFKKRNLL